MGELFTKREGEGEGGRERGGGEEGGLEYTVKKVAHGVYSEQFVV